MPKISVVVPVYKVEKYINRCVDSILNQTFTDFECILVDDGSPDNCGEICDKYVEKDNRIKVIHKENGGAAEARNMGIEISKGEYLIFVDSDDWIHPQMFEILYDGIVKNNVLLSVCSYHQVESEQPFERIENPVFEIKNGLDFYTEANITAVVPWCKLYHKSLFEDIRYPVGKLFEDEFTTYKALYLAGNIAYCNKKLYFYYYNTGSAMRSAYTLKKLDSLVALEERNAFFKEKGLSKYYKFTVRQSLQKYYWNYKKTAEKDEFLETHKELKRKIRNIVFSELGKGHLWIIIAYLEMLSPKLQKVFAIIRAICRKIYKTVSINRS